MVDINYGVDDLVKNCDRFKIDAIVNMNQSTKEYGDSENISGGNYDFVIMGDFAWSCKGIKLWNIWQSLGEYV